MDAVSRRLLGPQRVDQLVDRHRIGHRSARTVKSARCLAPSNRTTLSPARTTSGPRSWTSTSELIAALETLALARGISKKPLGARDTARFGRAGNSGLRLRLASDGDRLRRGASASRIERKRIRVKAESLPRPTETGAIPARTRAATTGRTARPGVQAASGSSATLRGNGRISYRSSAGLGAAGAGDARPRGPPSRAGLDQ